MLLISFLYRSYILSICSGFMDHCGFLSIDRPLTGYFGYPHGFAGNYTFKPTQMTLQAVVGFRDKERNFAIDESSPSASGVEGAFNPTPLRSGDASSGQSATIEDMGVDHSRTDILVAKEFLNGTYIISILKKMGSKAMAKGMRADGLIHTGSTRRLANCLLYIAGMSVMTQFFTGARFA